MTVPRSTVRLQFHRDFTFDDAFELVDYFAALGISHIYASPICTAEPGSMHGYDGVDYHSVNPELGGETALRRLAAKLRTEQMGLIADIVPNHMGVGGASNVWWLDILEWGRHSAYARHFDVDWHSPDPVLRGKVLAPILANSYGIELEAGNLTLGFDHATGQFHTAYAAHRLPICPVDYAALLRTSEQPALAEFSNGFDGLGTQPADQRRAATARAPLREFAGTEAGAAAIEAALRRYSAATPAGRERLHRLLERQHFRLAWWRSANDDINWRRFFDVATLAGVRAERPEVFEDSHALIFRLYREGVIDGVRVDHVDGLAEPRDYCQRLRQRLEQLTAERPAPQCEQAPYLIVEKILARGEPMRRDWQIDGTTGYDFMNDVGALLHDPLGIPALTTVWTELTGRGADFEAEAHRARRELLAGNLAAELHRVTRALHRLARANLATRDYSFLAVRRVLTELVVHYPVYRIYPINGLRSLEDELYFAHAREAARRALRPADHALLDTLDGWLGAQSAAAQDNTQAPDAAPGSFDTHRRVALVLFSQLTAPSAAKAVEDTACYRYGRLLSRNEVGADPADFALTSEAFHAANQTRSRYFPRALLCTATHDHKRGEDQRARLAVLSECADEWVATLKSWSKLNTPQRRFPGDESTSWAPGPAAEIMLYQTLVGAWPLELAANDAAGVHAFAERVAQWQLKALREAKLRTDWLMPDLAYEDACQAFLFDILAPQRLDGFLSELAAFAERIAPAGVLNSLLQTTLRLTSPGIPDLYQGTELWDFSLVDPDNRRPVDYALRRQCLDAAPPSEHLPHWRGGQVKQALIRRALALRTHIPALFEDGSYLPLQVIGPLAGHVIAFARCHGNAYAVVVATRLAAGLLDTGQALPLVPVDIWQDTVVLVPNELASRTLLDWFSGGAPKPHGDRLLVGDVLQSLPVALLVENHALG